MVGAGLVVLVRLLLDAGPLRARVEQRAEIAQSIGFEFLRVENVMRRTLHGFHVEIHFEEEALSSELAVMETRTIYSLRLPQPVSAHVQNEVRARAGSEILPNLKVQNGAIVFSGMEPIDAKEILRNLRQLIAIARETVRREC